MSKRAKVLVGATILGAVLGGASAAGAQGNVTDVTDHGHAFLVYGADCTPTAQYNAAAGSVTFVGAKTCDHTVAMGWQAWERTEGKAFDDQRFIAAVLALVEPGKSITVSLDLPCASWLQLDAVAVRDGHTQPDIKAHGQGAYMGGATVHTGPCAPKVEAPIAPPITSAPIAPPTTTTVEVPAPPTTAAPVAPAPELVTQVVERTAAAPAVPAAPELPMTGAGPMTGPLALVGGVLVSAGGAMLALKRRLI